MNIFAILAPVLGFIMEWIYKFIPNYGWTIILFTLIMKILMFPLQVKQQKSTARMSAFQPMIKEIQEKYKDDRVRMNEEMVKFQQESGFSMTAGCLPMILNMFIIFGMIEVVYPWEERAAIVCNDEGLLEGLPLNRYVPEMGQPIAGTFFVCGFSDDRLTGLTDEQLARFGRMFHNPQQFLFNENKELYAVMDCVPTEPMEEP